MLNAKMILNDEVKEMKNVVATDCFMALSQHLPGWTQESNRKVPAVH
jgi:hypothetical protein